MNDLPDIPKSFYLTGLYLDILRGAASRHDDDKYFVENLLVKNGLMELRFGRVRITARGERYLSLLRVHYALLKAPDEQ